MKFNLEEVNVSRKVSDLIDKKDFYLFYSTYLNGFTRDPILMSVPIDDHIVHRGDGVFDNTLCIAGSYYLLDNHIERFFFSSNAIGIVPPFSQSEMRGLLLKLGKLSGKKDFITRYFLSRGHGSMSVYPHEAVAPNLYVLIGKSSPPPERYFRDGLIAVTSAIGLRPPASPQVKSVNYLSNALMELAAKNAGADAAISVDSSGNLTEGSNKNVAVVGKDGVLRVPPSDKVLHGTTLSRALHLAEILMRKRILIDVAVENIPTAEAYNSAEMLFFSTSLFVAPVVKYDGHTIGDGKPGKVWKNFHELFAKDVISGKDQLTPIR